MGVMVIVVTTPIITKISKTTTKITTVTILMKTTTMLTKISTLKLTSTVVITFIIATTIRKCF